LLTPLFSKESILIENKYKSAGIIVSTFNNRIDLVQSVSFVGQDLYQSGRVGAKLMHMITPEKSKIIICHIDETFNNASHMQKKEKGFKDYFKEIENNDYTTLTLIVNKDNLKTALINFLNEHDRISGIFVTTSKTYNVVDILQDSEYKNVKVIGYDLLSENINFLKQNAISFLIHQSPKTQTHLGISYLIEHFLFNKEIPNEKLLPIGIVNAENLSTYLEH